MYELYSAGSKSWDVWSTPKTDSNIFNGNSNSSLSYLPNSNLSQTDTQKLGISGDGSTDFSGVTEPAFKGSLGSGSGWLGSDSSAIEADPTSWGEWSAMSGILDNLNKPKQQQRVEAPSVQIKHAQIQAGKQEAISPVSTTAIISKGGQSPLAQVNKNSFGGNY